LEVAIHILLVYLIDFSGFKVEMLATIPPSLHLQVITHSHEQVWMMHKLSE